jgi:tRNA pseudouridine55 synthase
LTSIGIHGWLILDKPHGLSSGSAVGKVKWALRKGGAPKTLKVGHGGTLDPLATGVLPIAIGEATKLSGYLLDAVKGYTVRIAFGSATSTDDAEGAVIETSAHRPSHDDILAVLPRFTGPISQVPPIYSALKVDGERAYALARAGEAVDLAPRTITIHALDLLAVDTNSATLAVTCSKGTYIRALARDMAVALGTFGHVADLRRTKAGPFTLNQAISLDLATEMLQTPGAEQKLYPLTAGLDDIPAFPVTPKQATLLQQGQVLRGAFLGTGTCMATLDAVPVAMVEVTSTQVRVLRGLNL